MAKVHAQYANAKTSAHRGKICFVFANHIGGRGRLELLRFSSSLRLTRRAERLRRIPSPHKHIRDKEEHTMYATLPSAMERALKEGGPVKTPCRFSDLHISLRVVITTPQKSGNISSCFLVTPSLLLRGGNAMMACHQYFLTAQTACNSSISPCVNL